MKILALVLALASTANALEVRAPSGGASIANQPIAPSTVTAASVDATYIKASSITLTGTQGIRNYGSLINHGASTFNSTMTVNTEADFVNSYSTGVIVKGFSRYTGPSANSGLLAIGNGAAARGFLDYDGTTNNYFTVGNTANTRINFVLGTASTPTTPLYVDTAEIVATVPYVPPIKTKAQFDAITATRSGQVYICSDCAVPFSLCVSTGTVFISGFRRADSTTAGCGTNN